MKPLPCRKYPAPAYPGRLEVSADPRLLADHLPPGFRLRRDIAGAAAAFLVAGMSVSAAGDKPAKKPAKAVVAPVFKHGEGRGAIGCQVVAPPYFLSEDDAWSVIAEELAKAGLTLSDKDVTFEKVEVAPRESHYYQDAKGAWKSEVKEVSAEKKALVVDREDPDRYVAVEFVSEKDHFDLGGVRDRSTVQGYDTAEVAGIVADKVARKGPAVYFGALYDPLTAVSYMEVYSNPDPPECAAEKYDENKCAQAREDAFAKVQAGAATKSKQLLRAQVKDFVEWLKAQGAI